MITKPTAVNVADNSTIVHTGGCYLYGVYVNTALSAHPLPIKDDTATIVTIPASAAAGAFFEFPGILFATSLVVDPDDAATGAIVVAWAPPSWAGV